MSGNLSFQLGIRVEPELLARIDENVARLRSNPENAALRMNRASLLRIAILRGLESLERETKKDERR